MAHKLTHLLLNDRLLAQAAAFETDHPETAAIVAALRDRLVAFEDIAAYAEDAAKAVTDTAARVALQASLERAAKIVCRQQPPTL